ncbi:MAG: hypothetical protein WC662_01585 [Candidatus Paceibacterota bacterium]|jgi:hypothetical protein
MIKYCTDNYGQNSYPTEKSCACDAGYVLGKENKCILFSNWCSELSNSYIKDGKCLCLDGYSYNDSSKTCKIIEVKQVITQQVVAQNEPIKKVAEKSTSKIKPYDYSKNSTEKEYFDKIVLPKEEITIQINPEPVKKLKWYQKIFNWFKGK